MRIKDRIGLKFGKLTVIALAYKTKRQVYWECRCDCGVIKNINSSTLNRVKSCGCSQSRRMEDKIKPGDIFGKLTVLYKYKDNGDQVNNIWYCKCECGNNITKSQNTLFYSKSPLHCGCSRKSPEYTNLNDMIGQKYNKLTILEKAGKKKGGECLFKCLCDCGNISLIRSSKIHRNEIKSCGCLIKDSNHNRQQDLQEKRFNMLLVLERDYDPKYKVPFWKCQCDCGNIKSIDARYIKSGQVSCGCYEITGEKHYYFDKNLPAEDRLDRGTPCYKRWRKQVLKRDNRTCQISRSKNNLEIHHLNSWKTNKEIRLEVSNGITLTKSIHVLFHNLYTYLDNTQEQFEEFRIKYQLIQKLISLLKLKSV